MSSIARQLLNADKQATLEAPTHSQSDTQVEQPIQGCLGPDAAPTPPHLHGVLDINPSQPEGFIHLGFPKFPELCAELRIKIWKYAASEPRLIEAIERFWPGELEVEFAAVKKAPAIFFVCHEAREEAMKLYTPLNNINLDGNISCNLSSDILVIRFRRCESSINNFWGIIPETLRKSIRRIALCQFQAPALLDWVKKEPETFRLVSDLEEIWVNGNFISAIAIGYAPPHLRMVGQVEHMRLDNCQIIEYALQNVADDLQNSLKKAAAIAGVTESQVPVIRTGVFILAEPKQNPPAHIPMIPVEVQTSLETMRMLIR